MHWWVFLLFRAEDIFFLSFFFNLFFFCLSNFFPGADAGFTKRGGHPELQRRQPCRPMWHVAGGGGADPSIGPWALETLGTPLVLGQDGNNVIIVR